MAEGEVDDRCLKDQAANSSELFLHWLKSNFPPLLRNAHWLASFHISPFITSNYFLYLLLS